MFLDIKIRRISNSFSASIYRKVTFSKVFTNFESFILVPYKSNLIFTLIFRAFNPNKAGLFEGSFFLGVQFEPLLSFVKILNFSIERCLILMAFLEEMVIRVNLVTFVTKDF